MLTELLTDESILDWMNILSQRFSIILYNCKRDNSVVYAAYISFQENQLFKWKVLHDWEITRWMMIAYSTPCGHKTFEHDFCTQTRESTNQNAWFHVSSQSPMQSCRSLLSLNLPCRALHGRLVSSMIFVLRALSKVLWLQTHGSNGVLIK